MTKIEAEKEFRYYMKDASQVRRDKVMMLVAWGEFTDALCKEGRITMRQYEGWINPFDK
jgi:hypothetical protein